MKNKITRTLTAFCAALLLMGGFSVTAFAQTPEEMPDATNDSGVVYEEPQPFLILPDRPILVGSVVFVT